jgi:hypothetical protein
MHPTLRPIRSAAAVLVLSLLATACGKSGGGDGGGSSTPTQPTTPGTFVNIAGTWSGSAYDASGNTSGGGSMTWQITQTSASFSGQLTIVDAGTNATGRGTVSGTVNDTALTFSMTVPAGGFDTPFAGCSVTLSGTGVAADTSINGNYSGSSSCSGGISGGLLTLIKQ